MQESRSCSGGSHRDGDLRPEFDSRRCGAEHGFQQQYLAVYESFRAHKDADVQSRLDTFAIPQHRFVDTVGPEHAARLAQPYSAEFAECKRKTVANFAGLDAVKTQLNIPPNVASELRSVGGPSPRARTRSRDCRPCAAPLPNRRNSTSFLSRCREASSAA